MSGIDWGDVSAVVAFGAAGVAVWQAREAKASREAAERAVAQAARSADAAEDANNLTRQQMAASAPPEVDWRVERGAGNMLLLRNVGTQTASEVAIDPEPIGGFGRYLPESETIAAGAAHEFLIIRVDEESIHQVGVRWSGHPEFRTVPLPR